MSPAIQRAACRVASCLPLLSSPLAAVPSAIHPSLAACVARNHASVSSKNAASDPLGAAAPQARHSSPPVHRSRSFFDAPLHPYIARVTTSPVPTRLRPRGDIARATDKLACITNKLAHPQQTCIPPTDFARGSSAAVYPALRDVPSSRRARRTQSQPRKAYPPTALRGVPSPRRERRTQPTPCETKPGAHRPPPLAPDAPLPLFGRVVREASSPFVARRRTAALRVRRARRPTAARGETSLNEL
ncbi:uncharacterized protein SCHCODRAFT_02644181 [Schizophyllum commune H4-8]|nr:uncharacterized protein SCHCODRAFT_02644181 [Schizophyllum commune H4-8]KAI5885715.1 hypothetical protein SCHCODRAFT_02644181 [Schizophyllum commune H4-8]